LAVGLDLEDVEYFITSLGEVGADMSVLQLGDLMREWWMSLDSLSAVMPRSWQRAQLRGEPSAANEPAGHRWLSVANNDSNIRSRGLWP
jgi:hypothetical protein